MQDKAKGGLGNCVAAIFLFAACYLLFQGTCWMFREGWNTMADKNKSNAPTDTEISRTNREKYETRTPQTNFDPPATRKPESEYKSVLGILRPGMSLYDKYTHKAFGIVLDIDWGRVEVLLADTTRVEGGMVKIAGVWFARSYITDNFVTNE
jgi:hypothetical protein